MFRSSMRLCVVERMRKEAHPTSQKLSNTNRVTSDRQQPTLGPHDLLAAPANAMIARSFGTTDWHSNLWTTLTLPADAIDKLTVDSIKRLIPSTNYKLRDDYVHYCSDRAK